MLERLGFQPAPGHPHLYALADHTAFGRDRAAQAVRMLRSAGYSVATDAEFEPDSPIRPRPLHYRVEPDVAFPDHRAPTSAATARHEVSQGLNARRFPISAAALAAGPATSGLPGKASAPLPAALGTAPRLVAPRIATVRNR
ncbi:hypothetical protein [Kitasatospora sp. HPMI-4]|uniref:hypothetical protein n=1 Tax=Kitasatospora sp. HPMI-4 TaxID=3448443 RepID=UPI003F1BF9E6